MLLVLVVGGALRFYRLGDVPPGLYQDEAYNGLDALSVLEGARPLYFPANNGREPLFIYLQAASVAAFGRTPFALRLPAAVVGTLLIPATYGLGRALFNRRVGLLAAAILAGSWWPLALSRIGLRAGTLPLLAALSLGCAVAGWRSRRLWLVALGGALYGLTFYTYLAARFTPLALFGFVAFWYFAGRLTDGPGIPPRKLGVWTAALAVPAGLVMAPLAVLAATRPEIAFGRLEQVSILSLAVNHGDPWGMLLRNVVAVLGMFVWRGDLNARHNLPGRPVFDALTGAAFLAGVGLCLWRVVRRPQGPRESDFRLGAALALIWCGVMLAPTVLSRDAPHYLRAVGVLPVIFLFPAVALDAAWMARSENVPASVRRGAAVLMVGAGLAFTARDYFGPYANAANTAYYFQSAATKLSAEINAYLGGGWAGEAPLPPAGEAAGRSLFLDDRLWSTFPQLRFLVAPHAGLHRFLAPPGPRPPGASGPGLRMVIWPHDEMRSALAALPRSALIRPEAGPLYRNDWETSAYPLYTTYTVGAQPPGARLGAFEQGISLRGAQVTPAADGLRVELIWAVDQGAPGEADYHVFVHLREGAALLTQDDGPPGQGLYPTRWWREGDWVVDAHLVPLPADGRTAGRQLWVGLYTYPAGERLELTDGSGDALEIPLDGRAP